MEKLYKKLELVLMGCERGLVAREKLLEEAKNELLVAEAAALEYPISYLLMEAFGNLASPEAIAGARAEHERAESVLDLLYILFARAAVFIPEPHLLFETILELGKAIGGLPPEVEERIKYQREASLRFANLSKARSKARSEAEANANANAEVKKAD